MNDDKRPECQIDQNTYMIWKNYIEHIKMSNMRINMCDNNTRFTKLLCDACKYQEKKDAARFTYDIQCKKCKNNITTITYANEIGRMTRTNKVQEYDSEISLHILDDIDKHLNCLSTQKRFIDETKEIFKHYYKTK